jgi:hypothetical protein
MLFKNRIVCIKLKNNKSWRNKLFQSCKCICLMMLFCVVIGPTDVTEKIPHGELWPIFSYLTTLYRAHQCQRLIGFHFKDVRNRCCWQFLCESFSFKLRMPSFVAKHFRIIVRSLSCHCISEKRDSQRKRKLC